MIFTDIATFKKYVTVDNEFDMENINPFEIDVKNEYMYRWFSEALITQILSFDAEAVGTPQRTGYELFMSAFARFLLLKYIPHGEVRISDMGIIRSENEHVKTAYAQQVKSLMRSTEDTAYLAIDSLVRILNENEGVFTEWPSSPGYTLNTNILVKTAQDFTNIQRLYRPYATFMHLLPNISTAQDLYIASGIKSDILDVIVLNNALDAVQKELKSMLDKALVHFTIAHSLQLSLVKLSTEGVRFVGDDKDTGKSIEESPEPAFISASVRRFEDTGYRYMDKAKKFINDNPGTFGESEAATEKKNFWM